MSKKNQINPSSSDDLKSTVIIRFIRSVDWKCICFLVASTYAFAIIWSLCSGELIINMISATTLVLMVFVGIPLGQIFIEKWHESDI